MEYYGVRPSNFIKNVNSIFYEENKEIVEDELNYLIDTMPQGDVWDITWTWFQSMEQYHDEFSISKGWWKAIKGMEKLQFLENFGRV